jgi:hypothetical protein
MHYRTCSSSTSGLQNSDILGFLSGNLKGFNKQIKIQLKVQADVPKMVKHQQINWKIVIDGIQ